MVKFLVQPKPSSDYECSGLSVTCTICSPNTGSTITTKTTDYLHNAKKLYLFSFPHGQHFPNLITKDVTFLNYRLT